MTESFYPNSLKPCGAERGGRAAIIMRTKDRPVLLARALSSVLQQSWQNWHLYLVNDGGDAASLERQIADYRPLFGEKLTLIHRAAPSAAESPRPQAANCGLQAAEGDFIALHDDDDTWRTKFLERTIHFLSAAENARFCACACRCELVCEEIKEDRVMEKSRRPWVDFRENISYADMLFRNFIPPISLLVRRAAAHKTGLFNEALPVLEDWDYFLRLMQAGDIGALDETLAHYHRRIGAYDAANGNTLTDGLNLHEKYHTLYTNALMRAAIAENPQNLGLMQLFMLQTQKLEERIYEDRRQRDVNYARLRRAVRYSGFFSKTLLEWKRFRTRRLKLPPR